MTAPEPPAASPKGKRSPALVAAIVIVVVIVLAGGAFVVYKLTKSKDEPTPAVKVAKETIAAIQSGDDAKLRALSTGNGTTQLLALTSSDAEGVTLTAGNCQLLAAKSAIRVCTATRPGGQLQLRLVFTSGDWLVNQANVGPAGLPPTSTTTTAP